MQRRPALFGWHVLPFKKTNANLCVVEKFTADATLCSSSLLNKSPSLAKMDVGVGRFKPRLSTIAAKSSMVTKPMYAVAGTATAAAKPPAS